MLSTSGIDPPQGIAFLSARKLRSGGVVYELNSESAAKWLNSREIRSAFTGHFGPNAVIKDRVLQVVVENVPTTFNIDSPMSLAETAAKSGLESGDIAKARWIKPISRRSPNQRTAH
ncbi:hypothetical protein BV22DRAFT_1026239, partial [Leucogyrophana mollusca]